MKAIVLPVLIGGVLMLTGLMVARRVSAPRARRAGSAQGEAGGVDVSGMHADAGGADCAGGDGGGGGCD